MAIVIEPAPNHIPHRGYRDEEPTSGDGLWRVLLKPALWGIGVITVVAVYIPMVVRAYWGGFRTFDNTMLKPLEKTGERFSALFSGDFSDHYLLGALLAGTVIGIYVRFLFKED